MSIEPTANSPAWVIAGALTAFSMPAALSPLARPGLGDGFSGVVQTVSIQRSVAEILRGRALAAAAAMMQEAIALALVASSLVNSAFGSTAASVLAAGSAGAAALVFLHGLVLGA